MKQLTAFQCEYCGLLSIKENEINYHELHECINRPTTCFDGDCCDHYVSWDVYRFRVERDELANLPVLNIWTSPVDAAVWTKQFRRRQGLRIPLSQKVIFDLKTGNLEIHFFMPSYCAKLKKYMRYEDHGLDDAYFCGQTLDPPPKICFFRRSELPF